MDYRDVKRLTSAYLEHVRALPKAARDARREGSQDGELMALAYDAERRRAALMCDATHPRCRVLWLHEVEGLTWAAVARTVCVSESTARRMAKAGRAELFTAMPERWRSDERG